MLKKITDYIDDNDFTDNTRHGGDKRGLHSDLKKQGFLYVKERETCYRKNLF